MEWPSVGIIDESVVSSSKTSHREREYIPLHNTEPPAHQVITTDTSNPLIRALKQKQTKPRADLLASARKEKETGKRPAEPTNDRKAEDTDEAAKRLRPAAPASSIPLPPIPVSGIEKLTKPQLEHILRAYNLPATGSKGQLVARVTQLQHRRQLQPSADK